MKNRFHSFALIIYLPFCVFAQQNPQPHFRNYSTEHGLPSPEVYVAFQDSKGYMWFGTDNGISRFDGYHFKNYGAKEGLTSNVVFDIFEDNDENIWFGTMTGEAFILKGDTIVPYRFNHLVQRYSKDFRDASLVYLKENGTAYFELIDLGILTIDSTGKDSLISTEQPLSKLILEVDQLKEVLRTDIGRRHDKKWISSINYLEKNQLFNVEIVSEKGRLQVNLPFIDFKNPTKFRAQKTTNGELLIFYYAHLYYFENEVLVWIRPFDYTVNEIIETKDQSIWICGAHGNGLRRYRDVEALKNGKYELFLNDFSISDFYEDQNGSLWVTTQEKGIYYCANWEQLIYNTDFGFSVNSINSVTFKNEQEIYVGTQNRDIFQVDLKENQIKNIISNPLSYYNVDLLYQSEIDALWSNGAYWKNGQWNFLNIKNAANELIEFGQSKLEKMHFNSSGKLLGLGYVGLVTIDVENRLLESTSYNFNLNRRTFGIHIDKENRLWLGNADGIFQFKDSILVHPGIEHPAFNSRVEDIDEFSDSSLVFGTKGWGAVIWKGKYFSIISEEEGLTTNMIEDVHVDENGILWIGTLNGLNKVTFDQDNNPIIRQYTMANGLPSNEIYKIKSYKGQVWLCTAGGLVRFQEQPKNTVAKAPTIQKLVLNGKVMEKMSQTRFSYQENNFAFHFLTINYHQNGNINYRFRLNSKADWSYTQNLSVNYPQLSPGEYQFEVQAQNEDGFWSESTSYGFEIQPPWWATSWFIGLLAMSFISSGFGLFQYRIAQLKKESLLQQQMTKLERAALQAQMNPHFIFNCLNSIQNFILQNDTQKAVEFLSRFARLVRLNLNASVEGFISLEEEVSLLDNYLALEQERFDHRFDYQIEMEEGLEDMDLELPPMLIQPFVENAIVHGISQQERQGKVHIKISKTEGHLLVKVQDNGTGHATKPSASDLPKHKSVGMSITQKRLGLLDAALSDTIKITTLTDDNRKQIGTDVTIRIKTKNDKKL